MIVEYPTRKYVCQTCDEELHEGSEIMEYQQALQHNLATKHAKIVEYTPEVEQ